MNSETKEDSSYREMKFEIFKESKEELLLLWKLLNFGVSGMTSNKLSKKWSSQKLSEITQY